MVHYYEDKLFWCTVSQVPKLMRHANTSNTFFPLHITMVGAKVDGPVTDFIVTQKSLWQAKQVYGYQLTLI